MSDKERQKRQKRQERQEKLEYYFCKNVELALPFVFIPGFHTLEPELEHKKQN